jgi:hypothetical protein
MGRRVGRIVRSSGQESVFEWVEESGRVAWREGMWVLAEG